MPTRREREYYAMGYRDGVRSSLPPSDMVNLELLKETAAYQRAPQRKRKLSDWQKYIKNKRNHIKYRDGKLNLKKMGIAFRRKKRR